MPIESRLFREISPIRDWNFEKETSAQILRTLDLISCQLTNMHKKKGSAKREVQPLFQPDYVKEGKKKIAKMKKENDAKKLEITKEYWMKQNPDARVL